jgi:hypothetical protein
MQEEKQQKEPIEMTTDEALDYVFHPKIAEHLRREAGKYDPPEEECSTEDSEAD